MMAYELRKSKPIRESDLVCALEEIDRDKNGRISLSELQYVLEGFGLKATIQDLSAVASLVDIKSDGTIDYYGEFSIRFIFLFRILLVLNCWISKGGFPVNSWKKSHHFSRKEFLELRRSISPSTYRSACFFSSIKLLFRTKIYTSIFIDRPMNCIIKIQYFLESTRDFFENSRVRFLNQF